MVEAILQELELRLPEIDEPVETIYFGGGTPSLLLQNELKQILDTIRYKCEVIAHAETTLEANPDDLTREKLEELYQLGFNRLSIGVQSFFEEHLVWMNRAHSAKESEECIRMAQEVGFDNITIDLIYGVPIMTEQEWEKNVRKAIELGVPHISAYNLTVEHKTQLHHMINKGTVKGLDDGQGEEHFQFLREELTSNGFVHYEVSNFGKEGFFSKHNTSYWQGKKYIGLGPSAHSYDGKSRKWNIANNPIYLRKLKEGELPYEEEILSPQDQVNEHLMIGLRNQWGCSWEELQKTGVNLTLLKTEVVTKINNGQLEPTTKGFKTTQDGMLFADGIAADLFVE